MTTIVEREEVSDLAAQAGWTGASATSTLLVFGNPALGMMSFGGDGRGCNQLSGWFVIDTITYSGNDVTALDARFEQAADGLVVEV